MTARTKRRLCMAVAMIGLVCAAFVPILSVFLRYPGEISRSSIFMMLGIMAIFGGISIVAAHWHVTFEEQEKKERGEGQ